MYYGLLHRGNIPGMVFAVVKSLWGSRDLKYQEAAYNLIRGTIATETQDGNYKDTTWGAGMGLTQFDELPFLDTRNRSSKYLNRDVVKIYKDFHVKTDKVEWEHLRYAPGLAIIFTALFYRLRPEAFPLTVEGQANYWKKWYNTEKGKGTKEHYIQSYTKYVDPEEFHILSENGW